MNQHWLEQAKRLQAIAATGLHFTESLFDRERYEEVARISESLLAQLADEPVQRIQGLVPAAAEGYATPKIDVRGAVFRNGEILLVQEAADGLWTLPGGYADLGLSAAENVVKEVREEACVEVRAQRLYAVRHKSKHGYDPDVRDFYKFFFLCSFVSEAASAQMPEPGPETTAAGFFKLEALPPLSKARTIELDIEQAWRNHQAPETGVIFD